MEPAPAVAGSSIPRLTPSLPDRARLFLSLLGSLAQRDAVMGSLFTAAGVTSAGVLPGPAAPVTSAAPAACSSASVPVPGVVTPADAASETGSTGRHERARESSAQRGAAGSRLVGRGPVRVGRVARVALPVRFVCLPPFLLSLRM